MNRFEIGGVKFIMAHERVDIPSVLKDIQVVIFGHSHMYYQQEISGRLWLNPGSCGYKRFTLPLSMAVMTIEDGTYEVETVWLEHGTGRPEQPPARGKRPKPASMKSSRNAISRSRQRVKNRRIRQRELSRQPNMGDSRQPGRKPSNLPKTRRRNICSL